jgi:hypothetical protein
MIDLILVLTAVEWVGLALYHRRTGRGVSGHRLAGNLLAGGCLLLAVRFALTGGAWWQVALCLLASLAAHVLDLRQRWR